MKGRIPLETQQEKNQSPYQEYKMLHNIQEANKKFLNPFTEEILLNLGIIYLQEQQRILVEKNIERAVEEEKLKRRILEAERKGKINEINNKPQVALPERINLHSLYQQSKKTEEKITKNPDYARKEEIFKKRIFPLQKELIKPAVKEIDLGSVPQERRVLQIKSTFGNKDPLAPGEIDFGKMSFLIRNPDIEQIECPGADKNILIRKRGAVMGTDVKLENEEIKKIMSSISERTRIPIVNGIIKVRIGNMEVVGRSLGSENPNFLIKKFTPPGFLVTPKIREENTNISAVKFLDQKSKAPRISPEYKKSIINN